MYFGFSVWVAAFYTVNMTSFGLLSWLIFPVNLFTFGLDAIIISYVFYFDVWFYNDSL
jgi:hypothetical protein